MLYPESLKNITLDNDIEINDLLNLAEEEDSCSNGVREFVEKRMEQGRDNIRLDPLVKVYHNGSWKNLKKLMKMSLSSVTLHLLMK